MIDPFQNSIAKRSELGFMSITIINEAKGYLPVTTENVDESRKVFLDLALGDRTHIQIDMQSLNADMTSFDIMSLYKYLTTVERQKRVTTHSVSYTEITRLSSSSGQDSFKVEPKNAHFYQTIPDSVLLRSLFDF